MDYLVETNTSTGEVEKEDSTKCADVEMTKSNDEEKNMMLDPQNPKKT